jgi:hypothetical protein
MLKSPSEDACQETLESAVRRVPTTAGVTRSAVVIAGPDQECLWSLALGGNQEDGADIEALPLRRFTSDGLRAWAQDKEAFTSDSQLEQLRDTTGGWPLLVDRLSAALAEGHHGDKALSQAVASLENADGAREFLRQAGLSPHTPQWGAYRAVLEFMTADGLTIDDLLAAIEADMDSDQMDAAEALCILRALQVFDLDSAGKYHLEPVLRACWNRVHTV